MPIRTIFSILAGFSMTFVAATIAAIAMRPIVSPMFGQYVRTDADGLAFAPLLGGYMVIALTLVWLVPRVTTGTSGWRHGAIIGAVLGTAVFFGDHLVTAGWSKLPALPMLISGIIDTIAVVSGGAAVGLLQTRTQSRP